MIISENDEAKRSRLWRMTIIVTSILIVVIAVYLLTKMFTTNPLEGVWESEDRDFTMRIGADGVVTVELSGFFDGGDVAVQMNYAVDRDAKTITIKEDMKELDNLAEKSDGAYTREELRDALRMVETTFDYSVDEEMLTLTEREYGEQLTFVRR